MLFRNTKTDANEKLEFKKIQENVNLKDAKNMSHKIFASYTHFKAVLTYLQQCSFCFRSMFVLKTSVS